MTRGVPSTKRAGIRYVATLFLRGAPWEAHPFATLEAAHDFLLQRKEADPSVDGRVTVQAFDEPPAPAPKRRGRPPKVVMPEERPSGVRELAAKRKQEVDPARVAALNLQGLDDLQIAVMLGCTAGAIRRILDTPRRLTRPA